MGANTKGAKEEGQQTDSQQGQQQQYFVITGLDWCEKCRKKIRHDLGRDCLRQRMSDPKFAANLAPDVIETILSPHKRMRTVLRIARDASFESSVPIVQYYNHVYKLYNMAKDYAAERHVEKAVCTYLRFASIVVEDLPCHRDYYEEHLGMEAAQNLAHAVEESLDYIEYGKELLRQVYDQQAFFLRRDLRLSSEACVEIPRKSKKQKLAKKAKKAMKKQPAKKEDDVDPKLLLEIVKMPTNDNPPTPQERLIIPSDAVAKFLVATWASNRNGVECFALLCGHKDDEDRYHITHVIIDGACFEDFPNLNIDSTRLKKYAPLILGWIHTHENNAISTCFDAHFQYQVQKINDQAVGIVCAANLTGGFANIRLSDLGMEEIGKCTKATERHKHNDTSKGAYIDTARNIKYTENISATLIDLRKPGAKRTLPQARRQCCCCFAQPASPPAVPRAASPTAPSSTTATSTTDSTTTSTTASTSASTTASTTASITASTKASTTPSTTAPATASITASTTASTTPSTTAPATASTTASTTPSTTASTTATPKPAPSTAPKTVPKTVPHPIRCSRCSAPVLKPNVEPITCPCLNPTTKGIFVQAVQPTPRPRPPLDPPPKNGHELILSHAAEVKRAASVSSDDEDMKDVLPKKRKVPKLPVYTGMPPPDIATPAQTVQSTKNAKPAQTPSKAEPPARPPSVEVVAEVPGSSKEHVFAKPLAPAPKKLIRPVARKPANVPKVAPKPETIAKKSVQQAPQVHRPKPLPAAGGPTGSKMPRLAPASSAPIQHPVTASLTPMTGTVVRASSTVPVAPSGPSALPAPLAVPGLSTLPGTSNMNRPYPEASAQPGASRPAPIPSTLPRPSPLPTVLATPSPLQTPSAFRGTSTLVGPSAGAGSLAPSALPRPSPLQASGMLGQSAFMGHPALTGSTSLPGPSGLQTPSGSSAMMGHPFVQPNPSAPAPIAFDPRYTASLLNAYQQHQQQPLSSISTVPTPATLSTMTPTTPSAADMLSIPVHLLAGLPTDFLSGLRDNVDPSRSTRDLMTGLSNMAAQHPVRPAPVLPPQPLPPLPSLSSLGIPNPAAYPGYQLPAVSTDASMIPSIFTSPILPPNMPALPALTQQYAGTVPPVVINETVFNLNALAAAASAVGIHNLFGPPGGNPSGGNPSSGI